MKFINPAVSMLVSRRGPGKLLMLSVASACGTAKMLPHHRRVRLFGVTRVEENVRAFWGVTVSFCLVATGFSQTQTSPGTRIEIDLGQQMAYLVRGRQLVLQSPICSGRYGYLTPTGSFKIIEKEKNHYSSLYGKIVDARGNTIVADADADMKVPRGGKFVPAPMHYFMRFHNGTGMHAGYLPGYPASHGCVRMPEEMAIAFFSRVAVGTPVNVFGRTPRTNYYHRYGPQPLRRQPWAGGPFDPRYGRAYNSRIDPRYRPPPPPQYVDPWWR